MNPAPRTCGWLWSVCVRAWRALLRGTLPRQSPRTRRRVFLLASPGLVLGVQGRLTGCPPNSPEPVKRLAARRWFEFEQGRHLPDLEIIQRCNAVVHTKVSSSDEDGAAWVSVVPLVPPRAARNS
jgi:hypothetical protein